MERKEFWTPVDAKGSMYICLVTMLEQYACTRLIEYLTFSGLFQEKKVFRIIVELLDYLLVFTAIISY